MVRPRAVAGAALLLCLVAGASAAAWAQAALASSSARRVQPPAATDCPREQLTLYAGTVQRWQRRTGRTDLSIHTEWGSTEQLRILHPGSDNPAPWFLLRRQAFQASDWAHIEVRPGQLRPGLKVAAWVCSDGRNPLLDWQPPAAP